MEDELGIEPPNEIKKIYDEDKKVEIQCHFCNKKYNFDENELLHLIKKIS